jgi:UDP-3-O-[3-hydroxymyristoyl] N-acetylglucosamine deacetylase
LRNLLSDPSAFEIVEATHRERGRSTEMTAVATPTYAPWMV